MLDTEERTFEATRFFYAAWAIVGVVSFFLILMIAVQPDTAPRRAVSILTVCMLGLGLLQVNRAGWPRTAGALIIAGLTALLTQRTLTSGGIAASATSLYIVIVMLAGLLLGEIGGVIVAALCIGVVYWIMTVTAAGALPPPEMHYTHFTMMLFVVMAICWAVTVQQLVAWSLRLMLSRARREADERHEAQLRLRLALDAGGIGVWDWNPATSEITADEHTFRLHGLPRAGGERISLEACLATVHPDDRVQLRAAILNAGHQKPDFKVGFRVVMPDDSVRYLECSGLAETGRNGQPGRVVGIHRNITAEKEAEQQNLMLLHRLRERLKELQLLHQAARLFQRGNPSLELLFQELVLLMTAAWQYTECCEARIVFGDLDVCTPGWKETKWKQEAVVRTATGPARIEVVYTQQRPMADEGPFLKEERVLLGSLGELLVSFLDLRAHQQNLERLVETRTQELAANLEQLKKLEQLRDDLVKMIVHDLRTPLTVLNGYLYLLRPHVGSENADILAQAVSGAETLQRMTNTLLDVSRLESGRMPLEAAPCDLSKLAEGVSSALLAMEPGRAIEVRHPGSVQAVCDAGLIRRVLENLISNGIKHTPYEEPVAVEINPLPASVRIAVRDRGPGVPEHLRERIFEKFGAVTVRKEKSFHSAGLGLAFCKLAVEAHGGSIGVDSAEPRGSVFWFEIPRERRAPAPAPGSRP